MIDTLTALAQALRDAGVPASPAEVTDAAQALAAAGTSERRICRLALRACLAKSAEHFATFDRLFDAYFSAPWPSTPAAGQKHRRQRPATEGWRSSGGHGQAPVPSPSPPESPGRRVAAPEEPAPRGRSGPARRLREETRRQQQVARARARAERDRQRRAAPARQPIRKAQTAAEVADLEREVERLGRLLRTRYGRRWRSAPSGRIDLRATIATGVRQGGVPWRLLRRRRTILKPRLLVLCDVSGSVARTARLLLRLLHETHRLFDRTAGFVFVDRPVAAAPLFRHADFDTALADLAALPGLNLHAYSDFGNVFVRLLTDHLDLLHPRTALLVLGDARCNQFDPQAWAFETIAARVGRVCWLNPEQRERWYTHDSRLRDYEPAIDCLLPAATVSDLAHGLDRLLRP